MRPPTMRIRAADPSHRFAIGQTVRMRTVIGVPSKAAETFKVTATLPSRDGSLQYRIRSETETHERVAAENNLEQVEPPRG